MHIILSSKEEEIPSYNELYNSLKTANDVISIEVKMECVGYANSHLDVAYDFILASYIGESLSKLSETITYYEDHTNSPYLSIIFTVKPKSVDKLAKMLHFFFTGLIDLDENFNDEVFLHEGKVHEGTIDLSFPQIVDDYFGNYITGYYDLSEDYVTEEIKKYPERRYGYWRSLYSNKINSDIYFSIYGCWLIPVEANINKIMHFYLNIKDIVLYKAELATFGNEQYLINSDHIVKFPNNRVILEAQKCATRINEDNVHYEYGESYDASFKEYVISGSGDILIARDQKYNYIFFYPEKLNFAKILELRSAYSDIAEQLDNFAGIRDDISCNWDQLDDEKFEQLCYDVLYHNEMLDSNKIRKMGKSRSRDGGRDLEIWTKALPGRMPQKIIVQCKWYNSGSSLTEAKMKGYAETVMKFNPDIYGVMTSAIIDSTLYDALDSMVDTCSTFGKKLETFTWSYLELERFLARNPKIKNRYF